MLGRFLLKTRRLHNITWRSPGSTQMVSSETTMFPDFHLTPQSILTITSDTIKLANQELDKIGSMENPTFEEALKKLAHLEATVQMKTAAASFLQHVSTSSELRDASVEAQMLLDDFYIEKGMREDVFKVVGKVSQSEEGSKLTGEDKRLLEKVLLGFRQNGLGLDPAKREILKEKRKRLAQLCTDFSQNINEDTSSVQFTAKELTGCPSDFIEGLQKEVDKFIVTTKYPDVAAVMQYAKNPETRRRIEIAFDSRASSNSVILEEAIRLRVECANLLGYETHADFQLEDRLAKNRKNVELL